MHGNWRPETYLLLYYLAFNIWRASCKMQTEQRSVHGNHGWHWYSLRLSGTCTWLLLYKYRVTFVRFHICCLNYFNRQFIGAKSHAETILLSHCRFRVRLALWFSSCHVHTRSQNLKKSSNPYSVSCNEDIHSSSG